MSKHHLFSSLVSCALLMTLPVAAQQEKGDTELQIQGSLIIESGDVDSSGFASLLWGRFISRNSEIGLTGSLLFLTTTEFDGFDATGDPVLSSSTGVGGTAGPFYRINFGQGTTIPYLGLSAQAGFGDLDTDVVANAELGVRWFLSSNSAFSLAVQQTYDFDASEIQDGIPLIFGFSHFIR